MNNLVWVACGTIIALGLLWFATVWIVARRKQLKSMQAEISELKNNLDIFNEGAQGIGRRLLDAERQLQIVASDQAQLMQKADNKSFTEAADLIAQGVSVEQVVTRCNLSIAEVELMALLNDKNQD